MLTYMRTRSKTWVKWIIFGAIIIVFVFWGGSAYLGREADMVAKIDKYVITSQEYAKAYENALKNLEARLGTAPTSEMLKQLKLKDKVLDQIIDDYILEKEAAKLDIKISNEELQKAIQQFPPFQQDGKFSMDNYRRVLASQRLTPSEFEELERKNVMQQRFYGMITENVIVSPEEVVAFYKYQNDSFNLNYLPVDAQAFVKDVAVTDQEAGLYYDKNKEKYKIPPKITLSFIDFPAASFVDKANVTEDEAREFYASHKNEFASKPMVHGRQILISVPNNADAASIEQKRALAKKLSDEIKAGADFASVAKKYSDDPGTGQVGGDLGLVPVDSLPQPTGETLAKMKAGEVSGPVQSAVGFHVLKLESKQEGKDIPFEQVSSNIIATMKISRAKILAGENADNAFRELYEQGKPDLAAYARNKGLQVKEIGPVAQGENIGVPKMAEIVKNAFQYQKGELGQAVETDSGYMVYMVKDIVPSRIPELSEIKDRVLNDVKMSKALDKAKTYAASLEKNRAGLEGTPHLNTGVFKRTDYVIPQIGMLKGVKEDLDKLKAPKTYQSGNTIYIVWLGSMQNSDAKAADQAMLKQIGEQLLSRKKEMAVETYMQEARKKYDIVILKDKIPGGDY